MRNSNTIFFVFIFLSLFACSTGQNKNEDKNFDNQETSTILSGPEFDAYHVRMTGYDTSEFRKYYNKRIEPPIVNFNQALNEKTLEELVLLKNTILAMKGHTFKDGLLFGYFQAQQWYQPPYWQKDFVVTLNAAEKEFIRRIENKETELLKNDSIANPSSQNMPNSKNVINGFQFENITNSFTDKLSSNGFVIGGSGFNQLFEIYERNSEENIPSFITTDLFLQELHAFYGNLENEIEELYLTNILQSMLEIINNELYTLYEKTIDPKVEQSIEESLLYYSIPYAVITGKKNNLIGNYNELYFEEIAKVLRETGHGSKIMKNDQFNYNVFKAPGHYSKNERIEKYYKSLTWLQKINLCLNDEHDLRNATLAAYIISKNADLQKQYADYAELKTYFSTQKQQFTLWDFAEIISEIKNIDSFEDLYSDDVMNKIKKQLGVGDNSKKQCFNVSLMPQEFQNLYTDLNELVKQKNKPHSVELFAALGNQKAKELFKKEKVDYNDSQIQVHLKSVIENLLSISSMENSLSMDWISTLLTSFSERDVQPGFMNNEAWKRKELSTSMVSWVKLNQRTNLLAEMRTSDKCISNQNSQTIVKGYVEPSINFWESAITILQNTEDFLIARKMLSKKSNRNRNKLKATASFLKSISLKELEGISLTDDEFMRIQKIGSEVDDFTLSLINPNYNSKNQQLKGTDKSITYSTNIYKNEIYGGSGYAKPIYVLVEIDGYIYMARGGVFSYYELNKSFNTPISRQKWEQQLNGENAINPILWTDNFIDTVRLVVNSEFIRCSGLN